MHRSPNDATGHERAARIAGHKSWCASPSPRARPPRKSQALRRLGTLQGKALCNFVRFFVWLFFPFVLPNTLKMSLFSTSIAECSRYCNRKYIK